MPVLTLTLTLALTLTLTLTSLAENGAHASEQKVAAQKQTTSIRSQLRKRQKLTLDPHSKAVQRWDSLTSCCLVFTASVTPFEVCVLKARSLSKMLVDPLSWINRAVDLVRLGYTYIYIYIYIYIYSPGSTGLSTWYA